VEDKREGGRRSSKGKRRVVRSKHELFIASLTSWNFFWGQT
jgi:hypothetical protein